MEDLAERMGTDGAARWLALNEIGQGRAVSSG